MIPQGPDGKPMEVVASWENIVVSRFKRDSDWLFAITLKGADGLTYNRGWVQEGESPDEKCLGSALLAFMRIKAIGG